MNVTLLGDIAGRMTQDSTDADRVTVAVACLPSGATDYIRKLIPVTCPKWSQATDAHVRLIVKLLRKEAFAISAMSVSEATSEWNVFWSEAAETHRRISDEAKGSVSVLKAATMVKFALYGQCSSLAVAHSIKTNKFPRPASKHRVLHVRETHIYDKEIEGNENVKAFSEFWQERNRHQPLVSLFGVELETVGISHETEQGERLLLLADYAAGIAHAAHSVADTLSKSSVSRDCAQRAHADLRATSEYTEVSEDFDFRYHDIFPAFAPGFGKAR